MPFLPGGEWVRSNERMPEEKYMPFFREFDPSAADPKAWVQAAKEAGMGYVILTAKHHDGFCLFDSELTDFKSTNTPMGRDIVREFLEAGREAGLKVGLYYSLIDWHHPDFRIMETGTIPCAAILLLPMKNGILSATLPICMGR